MGLIMDDRTFQVVVLIVNGLLTIIGTFIIFTLKDLVTSIKELGKEDGILNEKTHGIKEELYKDFPRREVVEKLGNDMIGRINRLEGFVLETFRKHEIHEKETLDAFKMFITSQIQHFQELVKTELREIRK